MTAPLERIAIVGAGTMGAGIAYVAMTSGLTVRLQDPDAGARARAETEITTHLNRGLTRGKLTEETHRAAMEKLSLHADLDPAVDGADLVIEAVPEKLDLKTRLLAEISRKVGEDVPIGSNTSSLSIGKIAADCVRPDRVLGMHFFNPPYALKLLELIYTDDTSDQTLAAARRLGDRMGRVIVVVRDSPGFASSRLGVVLGLEAMRMLEQGVATADDIDSAMVEGYRHPVGPLRLSDMVGLDVRLSIATYLHGALREEQYRPPDILRDLVKAGKLGRKSGQGFFRWET